MHIGLDGHADSLAVASLESAIATRFPDHSILSCPPQRRQFGLTVNFVGRGRPHDGHRQYRRLTYTPAVTITADGKNNQIVSWLTS